MLLPGSCCLPRPLDVVNEYAVTDPGRLTRLRHLEGNESAIIAYDWIRRLVAGIIAEVSEPLVLTAAIEFEFPQVNVAGPLAILFVTLYQGVLAVGVDPLRLVILARRVGVIRHPLRDQIDAADLGALVAVRAEGQFPLL